MDGDTPHYKSKKKGMKRVRDDHVNITQTDRESLKRQKNLKRVSALGEKEESERLLEELVFGAEEELLEKLNNEHDDYMHGNLLSNDSDESEAENEARLPVPPPRKAAWEDEEDAIEKEVDINRCKRAGIMADAARIHSKEKLQRKLREQFQRAMGGTPSWAEKHLKKKKAKDAEASDEDDNLLCKTGNFVAASETLPKGTIQMKNCLNANNDRLSSGKLSTVQFHPSAQVVMTAGIDQSVSLFQVDGRTNPKIQSVFLEKFPVYKARFSADGEQVVATSSHNKLFYVYDMIEGRVVPVQGVRGLEEKKLKEFEVSPDGNHLLFVGSSGYFHLLTMKTKELVCSMKINGEVTGAAFSPDGSKIYVGSDVGEVFVWSVKSRRCLNRLTDDGSLKLTALSVSKNGQYLACGSSSGVVNVYSSDACLQESNPKPIKAIMNLLTPISSLQFNPTTEILAIASNAADEAVRLVHIPSFTVFSNYPVFRKKTVYLSQCLDFSPNSGFFSVANNKGKALLYRLKHYTDF
ncbi:U3 small nucleolar RNA-associated protein 18 homolog isoform X1 [Paramormyrops kingsleyae]|uniref:U3 small nucleolar RNA-associated protein 18 homolog isoform X1 n=2 Tax=Paramormyrops kingsleyae TaxID=1676925 RepID=UPI003B978B6A